MTDPGSNTQLIIGQAVLLLTTISGFIVTAWRENRNRKWAAEDRQTSYTNVIRAAQVEAEAARIKRDADIEALRQESARMAELVKLEAVKVAAELAASHQNEMLKLHNGIADVKHEARAAYNEANHVNQKLVTIGQQILQAKDAAQKNVDGQAASFQTLQDTVSDIKKVQGNGNGDNGRPPGTKTRRTDDDV